MSEDNNPKVGLGVAIIRNGKILFGKRKNSHGEGSWCFPGGHLEFGESWEECARRETLEETGLEIENIRFATATNDLFKKENKHYITILMVADWVEGEARILEPEKCEKWDWFDWNEQPSPLFMPQQNLNKKNFNPLNFK